MALGGGIASSLYQAHRAQQRFEEVRSLAHTFLFDLHDDVARLDGSTAVRKKMVRTALLYLDSLSKNAGGDPGLQKELAAAYQKVGDAQGYPARPSLGRTRDAVASYRRAAEIHEAAARRDPAYRLTLGPFYTDFGNLLRYQGAYDEARRTAENARDILEQVTQAHPDDGRAQRTLAASWCLLGDIDEERFHNSRAFENFSKCDALADQVLKRWPDRDSLEMAEHARARVGTSSNTVGHLKEALAAFDDDEKLLAEMALREPSNPRFKRAAAVLAQFRSTVYYDDDTPNLGDPAECLKYSRIYLDNARRMVETDPNNASARLSLAIALFRLSFPLKDIDAKAAVESAKESARIFDELIAAGKNSFLVTSRRARALRRLSVASIAAGRNAEARKIVSDS